MPFIKSHSNYVLKSKHQGINDGTIYERDITTIGAVNQFAPGQTPIYRSNNFIITVRNDGRPANQYNTTKWKENDNGDIWTLQVIDNMTSDFEDENDTKIVLKQDYYDFRDFAYYGSLTELFRASVTDILAKFPGELYLTDEHAYYTVRENYDFDRVEKQFPLGGYGNQTEPDGSPKPKYYLVSNPFNINLHAKHLPKDEDPLKYFAEEGYLNYRIGFGSTTTVDCDTIEDIKWCEITAVKVIFHDPCSKKPDIPFCDCDTMTIELFDPSKCNCDNVQATLKETRGGIKLSLNLRGESEENDSEEEEESEEYYRRVVRIEITFKCEGEDEDTLTIYGYLDDNNRIVYLMDEEQKGNHGNIHIRPKEKFIERFYSEIDNFQKLLVNRDTNYKATFSIIYEDAFGYHRRFDSLNFPIGDGGYNLDATEYGFSDYTTKMVEIGEYYDENFTDNLWRSMTHEAIKNFDWTYTREYEVGDEEEYVLGGQRIQKAIRIFAREFDEIISYINNIKNLNRVTYDERGNLPNYFLTDTVENEGWDVKLVYPYDLKEYYISGDSKIEFVDLSATTSGTSWTEGGYIGTCVGQLNNAISAGTEMYHLIREFSQNSTNKVKPYTKMMIDPSIRDGYFMVCTDCFDIDEKDKIPRCGFDEDSQYAFVTTSCLTTVNDDCALSSKGVLKNRIKTYTDEAEWSYQEVNNEFLRRLKLNSRYIWRHKGTIDGIEMILGMFGLKSRRWFNSQPQWVRECNETAGLTYDYDMREYTSFTSRLEETWDVVHQNYRINWINSTKAITYDNRFVSNYNRYGANKDAFPYQGIPVSYREAYVSQEGDNAYLGYSADTEEIKYIDADNNLVKKRYLYPYFDKYEQLDGNPYYQMRGGWLSKTIVGESADTIWNFQFDVDDNIVYNKYLPKGRTESGFTYDNYPLYKETIRNIRRVDNIASLLALPTNTLHNGVICYVTKIEKDSAVIDNGVYPIVKEWHKLSADTPTPSGEVVSYVVFTKTDGFIRVGSDKFFDNHIIVYDIEGKEREYKVEEMNDGDQIKAYIVNGGFICKEDANGYYSINSFQVLDNPSVSGFSNYFMLNDINYADMLAEFKNEEDNKSWTNGWRRLSYTDKEYLKISTITNYYGGNNPHNGNMRYDNGHEYFTYYKRLFKHAIDNELFDERCYEDYFYSIDNEIMNYGFSGLIEMNEDILQYDDFLIPDTKIHYFGNYKTNIYNLRNSGGTVQASANTMFLFVDASGNTTLGATDYARESGLTIESKIDRVWVYGDDTYYISGTPIDESGATGGYDLIYITETDKVSGYNLSASTEEGWVEFFDSASTEDYSNPYNPISGYTTSARTLSATVWNEDEKKYDTIEVPRYPVIDDVTKQIVNNKIFDITFRLHNIWYSKKGQDELKYIDDIVMNYLTQMIPSTTILRVRYELSDAAQTET